MPPTPKALWNAAIAALSAHSRHIPLTMLTEWQGTATPRAARAALDQAVWSDDLPTAKAATWRYVQDACRVLGLDQAAVVATIRQRQEASSEERSPV